MKIEQFVTEDFEDFDAVVVLKKDIWLYGQLAVWEEITVGSCICGLFSL